MNSNILHWRSLKTRVTFFTLAIFLIGVWAPAFYVSHVLREDMRHLLGEQQFSTASIVAAAVDSELSDRLAALELIANEIDEKSMGKPAVLQALLEQRPVIEILFNAGAFIVGIDGVAIAEVPLSMGRVGLSYADRDYMGEILKGKSAIGRPIMGKMVKAPSLPIAVPIRDSKGKVIGGLVTSNNLAKPNFLDKITESKYGKTGGYLIVAPQHRLVVTATDRSRVMEQLPPAGKAPVADRFLQQGWEGYDVLVNPLGVESLFSLKAIPVAGWYLLATLPTADAFAPVQDMQRRMLLATALLTLLAGVLVWWATWWMLRRQLSPMIAATRTMDALSGKGQPLQLIPVTSNDEIAELIGGFNRLLGVVTQREEALKASEQSLQLFIDHAPAALAMFDRDMRYMSASRRWLSDYGLGGRELRGLCHYDVFPEIPEYWKEIHRRALAGEELRSEVERFDRADGSTQWIRWEVLPWRDPRGNVGGIVIFSEDLSEIKRGEEARLRLEAQLRESQKMEALGTLAGGVAHDFNNVLAMILGNVELARQDVGADHPAQVSLEEIAKASRRAKDLVQQILSFGRRQKLERNATSLSLVVVETARLMRATLPATVRLNVDCAPDVPAVLADATQIKQVLVNLCGNAADAIQSLGRPGSIDVSLRSHVQTEGMPGSRLRPGRYACLRVSDTGQGMDEATRSHMFEPFFTTKPMGKGTGLGLAVVHGIVQAHEASVEVESAPGAGSTFRIYFPASDAPVETLVQSESGVVPIDGAGRRVLYVDDEQAIVFLMKRLLERQGFRVSGYTDPQEALAAVRADPAEFDLAVTDYNMPGMDGLRVARALKEIRADLPVVLASGYITEDLRAKAPEAGVRELIYKPNTVDDLCAAVARCANAKSGKDKPS